jgi:hypothetical protein
MARTIRVWWREQSTGWKNFNWPGVINARSVVHISACEAHDLEQEFRSLQDHIADSRFRGEAFIGVRNVRPHNDEGGGGGVEFVLEVFWGVGHSIDNLVEGTGLAGTAGPRLNVVTDITVEDPAEEGVVVG